VRAALAVGSLAVVTALTYVRLYFGVDFTDESFYTAVPYRFVHGARPLIDETSLVQQTPGLLLYPFVKLWDSAVGLDGIILYARHLHLLFSLAVAFALFVSLRRILEDRSLSAVLAGAAIAFVPFGIHGLSYNTFSSGFFTAGCFLGATWLWGGGRRTLAAAGIAHGLAIFTYPPFALAVACFLVALWTMARPRSLRALGPALVPIAAGVLAVVVFFARQGFETTRELLEQRSTFLDQGGGLGELRGIVAFVSTTFTHKYLVLALLAVALLLLRKRPAAAVAPLLVLPLTALPADLHTSASSNEFVTNFALLAPALALLAPSEVLGRRLLAVVWLPAAVAGLTTALNSTNGGINLAIGFFPAAIVTAVLLALAIQRALGAGRLASADALAALAPAIVFVAVGVALQYLSFYRDAGLSHLTARVADGAYAGIYTTERKRDFITTLDRDLAAASGPDCRIVFYDSFPAGYLFGHGVPETNATWLVDVADDRESDYQQVLVDYYQARGNLPEIAVRLERIPLSDVTAIEQSYGAARPLERLFHGSRYVTVLARDDYSIRRLRSTTCRR
jgi:hypothetical protein